MRSPERLRDMIVRHTWNEAYPYTKPMDEYGWRMAARDTERELRQHFKDNPPTKPTRAEYLAAKTQ